MGDVLSFLFNNDCIKSGEFTLASGIESDLYIDLRDVFSDFKSSYFLLEEYVTIIENNISVPHRCGLVGIPYSGLIVSSYLSTKICSQIVARPKGKTHGNSKQIYRSSLSVKDKIDREGVFVVVDRREDLSKSILGVPVFSMLGEREIREGLRKV